MQQPFIYFFPTITAHNRRIKVGRKGSLAKVTLSLELEDLDDELSVTSDISSVSLKRKAVPRIQQRRQRDESGVGLSETASPVFSDDENSLYSQESYSQYSRALGNKLPSTFLPQKLV
jgi:hypothetical protein